VALLPSAGSLIPRITNSGVRVRCAATAAPPPSLSIAVVVIGVQDNVWLAGRRQEQVALGRIIAKLERTRMPDGPSQAVRGAGVDARNDAITRDPEGS
jgi:hypothetical protein